MPIRKLTLPDQDDTHDEVHRHTYRMLGGDRVFEPHSEYGFYSELDWAQAVEEGLPTAAVEAVMERCNLSWQEIGEFVIPRRTFSHRKQKGASLTTEESDRLLRLARVIGQAEETFQDTAKARRWLRSPNRALDGQTPLAMLKTDSGARLVEKILGRIAYGVYS